MNNNSFDPSEGEKEDSGFSFEAFIREQEALLASEPEVAVQQTKRKKEKKKNVSDTYDWIQCIVAALLFCVIVFSFFFRIIGVIGISMVPSFHDGDRVLISNLFYEPQQGDVVILRKESFSDDPIIKRVIATAGQMVEIDFDLGIVYVDGVALDEPYTAEPTHQARDFDGRMTVPENSIFVMGDNRNFSLDSRSNDLGCVDERYIIGKVLLRVVPFSDFGIVK